MEMTCLIDNANKASHFHPSTFIIYLNHDKRPLYTISCHKETMILSPKMHQERINYIDFIKGIAIIAVVFGHIRPTEPVSPLLPVRAFLGLSWHINVFFLVSGFFLLDVDTTNIKTFLTKKFKRLYLTALYFYLPIVLLHNVFMHIGWYETGNPINGKTMVLWDTTEYLKQILLTLCCAGKEPLLAALWFIYALFFAMIVHALLSLALNRMHLGNKKIVIVALLAITNALILEAFDISINRITQIFQYLLIIYIGQFLHQKAKLKFDNGATALISLIVLYCISVALGIDTLNKSGLVSLLMALIGCTSALYLIAYIGRKIEGTTVEKLIRYCGKESLYIMALHFIGFKLCSILLIIIGTNAGKLSDLTPNPNGDVLFTLLYLVFGVLFPLTFMWLFRKAKRKMLMCYVQHSGKYSK